MVLYPSLSGLHPLVKCNEFEFRCSDRRQCIEIDLVCDDAEDCRDKSDEADCEGIYYTRYIIMLHLY